MARLAIARAATAAIALTAWSPAVANAQFLSLHVRSFAMSADRTHLRLGEQLHLTITAHVDERVLELDNVTLPDLSGFDTLGDERRCTATSGGSDCTETLTLEPTVAGDRTIAATVMDAIDARNNKASRFATNTLALRIAPAAPHVPSWLGSLLWSILFALLPLAFVVVAAWALIWGFRRGSPAASVVAAAVPASAPVVVDHDARLRELIAELARDPTRTRALAVRAALRARVGARADETLADIAERREMAGRERVLAALRAIERASFCEDARVAQAVEEALPSLQF